MDWDLEILMFVVQTQYLRKRVWYIFARATNEFFLAYPEPRNDGICNHFYDEIFFRGMQWLNTLWLNNDHLVG